MSKEKASEEVKSAVEGPATGTVADKAKAVEITDESPTEVGARYMVNGVLVDAWGKPIEE